ncbi:hypothetical protein ABZY05_33550 [Streptomyces canus]|uniref:hypothetical protein n=1 Tax=Streptomyces canus TaxID=58343 RepID=UPI0033AE72E7
MRWARSLLGRPSPGPPAHGAPLVSGGPHIKQGQYEISGVVKTGDDERTRGTPDANPLRIDGSCGHWDEIEGLWLAGELTDDEFEDHFIDDVIVEVTGRSSRTVAPAAQTGLSL